MSKSPVFRCTCCNSEMSPKRKKPVTTWSGQMNTVFADKIEDFPVDDWEDLCPRCIKYIQDSNADLTKGMENTRYQFSQSSFETFKPVRLINQDKMEEECSDLRMDVEFRYVDSIYQGGDGYIE